MQGSVIDPGAVGRAGTPPGPPALAGQWFAAAAGLAVCAAFALAYYPTIVKLAGHWSSNDMYSYGFLIPAISGYLIWLRRDVLRGLPASPSLRAGVLVLGLALTMLVAGRVAAVNLLEEASLPVAVFGLAVLVLGAAITGAIAFPLAYLFTMIPFWDVFTSRLHLPFQLYSAAAGVAALRLFDIPVFHRGVFIDLPNITLHVAELCSGVNNLVAVLCIGIPMTHLYVKGWSKRALIIATAVLIALLSNGLRVALVSLLAYYGIRGADGDIHGPYSLLRSLVIAGIGYLVLFWLISRFADREPSDARREPSMPAPRAASRSRLAAAAALAVALVLAGGTVQWWRGVRPVPLGARLVAFPTTVGGWGVRPDAPLAARLNGLEFDETLVRGYARPDGQEVNLFLGYLASQTQGRELAGEGMLSGLALSAVGERGSRSVGSARLNEMVARSGADRLYVTYGYVLDDGIVSDGVRVKVRTAWNALAERRTNAGLVLVAARMGEEDTLDAGRARVAGFVDAVLAPAAEHLRGVR